MKLTGYTSPTNLTIVHLSFDQFVMWHNGYKVILLVTVCKNISASERLVTVEKIRSSYNNTAFIEYKGTCEIKTSVTTMGVLTTPEMNYHYKIQPSSILYHLN